MMAKAFFIFVALSTTGIVAYSQTPQKKGKDSSAFNLPKTAPTKTNSITFHLTKVEGIGPGGFSSTQIGTTDSYKNSTEAEWQLQGKAYPVIKNKPTGLSNVIEYCYMLDEPQFCYQNYVAGIYPKDFLLTKFKQLRFKVEDTVKLSRQPLKCYVSVLAGFNAAREPVFIVDANNNGDFADDVLRPVLKNVMDEALTVSSSVPVTVSYLYNNQIKETTKLVFIQQHTFNPKDPFALNFSFPEFRYMRFSYKGQPYLITTDNNLPSNPFYTIVPDRPYFVSLTKAKKLKIGELAQIGDDMFNLADVSDDGAQLTLTGTDVSNFAALQTGGSGTTKTAAKTGDILGISRQVGFKAPAIKGINMNPQANLGAMIATEKLKGKYVFVDFWSTTCPPCIQEFDYLKEVYAKYKNKNFEIIGVVDERGKGSTVKILDEKKVLWPNIKTETPTTQINGYEDITSYPTTYLLDPTGKIIAVDLRTDALMNKLKALIGI